MYSQYFYTIRSAFWGYRKSQIDEYISEMIHTNRKKLSELSRRIEDLEEEKRQLEMVSFDLKRDILRFSAENMPVDMFVEIFETMDGIKRTQPAQVIEHKDFDETELIKTIHGVEDSVKQELGILSGKVDALAGILKNLSSMQIHNAETYIDIAEIKESTKNKETDRNEAAGEKKPEPAAPAVNMGKVLNFLRVNTALAQNTVKKEIVKKKESAFWGNAANGYQTSEMVSMGIDTQEILDYVNRTVDMMPFNSFFDNHMPVKKGIKSSEIAAVLESKKNTFTVLQQSDKAVEKSENESIHQVEIDEDARYIRQKYIVGKIAGQDLFDRKGNLIIGGNSKITSQAVDLADREGKLPELIINMILPDLE